MIWGAIIFGVMSCIASLRIESHTIISFFYPAPAVLDGLVSVAFMIAAAVKSIKNSFTKRGC